MVLKITQASPVLHKDKYLQYSIKVWNVTGTITPDCNCKSMEKKFETYIKLPRLVASKQEIYQYTKNQLKADGKII